MTFSRLMMATIAAAGLAFGTVAATPVAAQDADTQQQASFSDDKLRSFAVAAVKLSQIRSDYEAQMGETETDQEKAELQQQTNQRMAKAVKDTSGISVEEYNQIAAASRSNPEVAKKVRKYIKETAQ